MLHWNKDILGSEKTVQNIIDMKRLRAEAMEKEKAQEGADDGDTFEWQYTSTAY